MTGGVGVGNRYDFLLVACVVIDAQYLSSLSFRFPNGCSKEEEVKVEDPQSSGLGLEAFGSVSQHLRPLWCNQVAPPGLRRMWLVQGSSGHRGRLTHSGFRR